MKFASIGSGSKGNGSLIASDSSLLMVDCGFSAAETERRMAALGCAPEQLDALLLTHEHSDHMRGIAVLARKYSLPVYMTHGTAAALKDTNFDIRLIEGLQAFELAGISVQPVAVPHDARQPCQFVFSHAGRCVGVLSDLGHITPQVVRCYSECDLLFVETNHCPQMLAEGPYPYALQQRVGGDWGHLANGQTAQLLQQVNHQRLQQLVLGHISEQNNHPDRVLAMLQLVPALQAQVCLAQQQQGVAWLQLN